ncbi:MAG: hypothetical protein JWN40_5022 [Phycisphaerales bacterium]|nr:hypothetical protein [Phycisphaerales bacterium]
MLILRLKRCERALAGGRLEEAMQLLLPADARAHRQGQALLDRLVGALVERGRGHLADGRLGPAEADWHAGASLAGNTPVVAQLRASIDQVAADRQRAADERRRAKGAVEAFVRQGQFTLAHDMAAAGAGGAAAGVGALVADVAVNRAASARLADDVATALAQNDWETAVDRIAATRSPSGDEPRVRQLKREVAGRVADEAGRLIDAGRLDEAASVLRRAAALGPGLAEIDSLRRGLDQCRIAWQSVRAAQFAHAREVLARLAVLFPGARWIGTACAELGRACEAIQAVRGGTLGMLDAGDATIAFPATAAALAQVGGAPIGGIRPVTSPAILAPPQAPPRSSARRFLLHVDGAGSYLVLQGSRFEVGPVSASRPADLPLVVAAGSPTLTFSRCDDDYFLSSVAPVPVNDRAATGKLLATGDRIAVGPRGRIEFRRPNAASGTAVLRISGARLPWGGVREVLLMDREIVLGASAAAHVRVGECPAPVILQAAADGGLVCRGEETVVIDGRACGRCGVVGEGARVAVGAVSFVIRRE